MPPGCELLGPHYKRRSDDAEGWQEALPVHFQREGRRQEGEVSDGHEEEGEGVEAGVLMRVLLLLALASPAFGGGVFRANVAIGNPPLAQDEDCNHDQIPDPCNDTGASFTRAWSCDNEPDPPTGFVYELDQLCADAADEAYASALEACAATACHAYCLAYGSLEDLIVHCDGDPNCLLFAATWYSNKVGIASDAWGECRADALEGYMDVNCCMLVKVP